MMYNPSLLINLPGSAAMTTEGHDLTSELLYGMRLLGLQYRRIELAAPFGVGFVKAPGRAQFNFVSRGSLLLRTLNGQLRTLNTGYALLLQHGSDHVLLSSPDVACKDIRAFNTTPVCGNVCCIKDCASTEETTLIFSGCMEFDLGGMQMLIGSMPEVLLADALECGQLVRVLEAYTPQPRPVHLLWRQDLRPLPKLTRFVEHVLSAVQELR